MIQLAKDFLIFRYNAFQSRKAIERQQEKDLRRILLHAWQNSPWYRVRFEKAGITEDNILTLPLTAFPTMSKNDLMANFESIVTDPQLTQQALRSFDTEENREEKRFMGAYHIVHSSGSTGKPAYFVYDEPAWNRMLLGIIRGALWDMSIPQIVSLLLRKTRILYVAATGGRYGGAMAVSDGVNDLKLPQQFLDINQPAEEWLELLRSYQPQIIIGYPTAVSLLCNIAEENHIQFKPERIITCGEPLPTALRTRLKQATGAAIINFYGASESLALGVAGDTDEYLTLFDDMNIIEVVNGEMYFTCLYNMTQPLIRYHLTDQLNLHAPEGAFSRADIVLSRSEDILWFTNKDQKKEFLHPLAVEGFCMEGLTDYQFVKHDDRSFTIRAVAEEEYRQSIFEMLQTNMQEILYQKHLHGVNFQIQFVKEILPDPQTGKKKLILCE